MSRATAPHCVRVTGYSEIIACVVKVVGGKVWAGLRFRCSEEPVMGSAWRFKI